MKEQYRKFGYDNLGPLLYGFSCWLLSNFKERNISKVYFFSRDGFIMKQAFEKLKGIENIRTYYLEVSRKSLRIPILWKDPSYDNILTMLSPSMYVHIESLFDAIGLDIDKYDSVLRLYGLTKNDQFSKYELINSKALREMYACLIPEIIDNSKKEYNLLQEYIKQNELCGKFAIVDIGWSGGMQRFLQTTLKEMNIDCDIHGFYTGVAEYYKRNISQSCQLNLNGYLFDYANALEAKDERSCFVGLYEMLFLETKGSVIGYYLSDGKVYAKRGLYEYEKDGVLLPEVDCIREVQNGALEYVGQAAIDNENLTKEMAFHNFRKAGSWPSKEALQLFGKFRFFDEGVCAPLINTKSFWRYLKNPKSIIKDFMHSRWKSGFLRSYCLIPFPYYKVYNFLYRFKK